MNLLKTKVLLLQGTIPSYRVDIFNELAERVDLTVVYSYGKLPDNVNFKTMYIPTFKLHYNLHKKNIYHLANKFNVVICMYDFSYLYFRLLYILPHKYKLIFWGIGVRAGYNTRYDSDETYFNKIKNSINKADAIIFYSSYPKEKYAKNGIPVEKMFVANNTVRVFKVNECNRDKILFVGSLYKQKKIFELLENYFIAYKQNRNISDLIIIGDGDERQVICEWIEQRNLTSKVILTGAIYDERKLAEYFSRGLICISPDQAGLSVLKSMGYGVPFVTHKNAITGGEIFNIKNGVNGILIDSFDELEKIILDTVNNKEKFITMGRNAIDYYYKNRTVSQMVDSFEQSINYVIK